MRKCFTVVTAIIAVMAAGLLGSCASMKLATVRTQIEPTIAATARGKSLKVAPVEIQLSAARSEFDLRGVTVSVDGQTFNLGGRYLETTDDMDLGKVGVLDTNIFKKAKVDVESLSDYATDRLVKAIGGTSDIRILINPDKPDVGELSTRPLVYDLTKYPWVGQFDPAGQALPPVFSKVITGAPADYTLSVKLEIRSEIYEILEDSTYVQNKFISADHKPAKGDYYLDFVAFANFKLTDASGKVVMDDKTRQAYPVGYAPSRQLYLPVKNRDATAYAKYFRSYDFSADARGIVDRVVDNLVTVFRPLYSNLNQYVKEE